MDHVFEQFAERLERVLERCGFQPGLVELRINTPAEAQRDGDFLGF